MTARCLSPLLNTDSTNADYNCSGKVQTERELLNNLVMGIHTD